MITQSHRPTTGRLGKRPSCFRFGSRFGALAYRDRLRFSFCPPFPSFPSNWTHLTKRMGRNSFVLSRDKENFISLRGEVLTGYFTAFLAILANLSSLLDTLRPLFKFWLISWKLQDC